jgi:hypothetical protein
MKKHGIIVDIVLESGVRSSIVLLLSFLIFVESSSNFIVSKVNLFTAQKRKPRPLFKKSGIIVVECHSKACDRLTMTSPSKRSLMESSASSLTFLKLFRLHNDAKKETRMTVNFHCGGAEHKAKLRLVCLSKSSIDSSHKSLFGGVRNFLFDISRLSGATNGTSEDDFLEEKHM